MTTGIWRSPFIAELDGRAIGFLEIIDPAGDDENHWDDLPQGNRAIDIRIGEPDALGRCFADPGIRAILVDPFADNIRSHRFYQQLGFVFVEERTFGADHCLVFELIREKFFRITDTDVPLDLLRSSTN